jgi:small-conductance mechanosensitive channel
MQDLIEKIARQMQALLTPSSLVQMLLVAVAIGTSIWIGRRIRATHQAKFVTTQPGMRNRFAEGLIIVSPLAAALLLTAAVLGFLQLAQQRSNLVAVALQLIGLLLVIRAAVYVLRVSVGDHAPIKGWGNTITLIVWIALSLHALDWLDPVVAALDSIGIKAGATRISVWSVVKVLITVTTFILVAVWLARWIEQRLMSVTAVAIGMRIGLSKFVQAFLVGLSVLLGLNAAGLDLTTLTVLTGAIGIGLGFGLQAVASNFISGFVLLLDRSIKPGDVISLSGIGGNTSSGPSSMPEHFGWVQELRGRYVVVRDRDGVETLVPNQHFITNPIISWSYGDPRIRLRVPIRVSYKCDSELALKLLTRAAVGHQRVLTNPTPVARLMAFGESGFEMELRFWISDPQEGVFNIRSDVNRSIWKLFQENGIVIPITQRDVVFRQSEPRKSDE